LLFGFPYPPPSARTRQCRAQEAQPVLAEDGGTRVGRHHVAGGDEVTIGDRPDPDERPAARTDNTLELRRLAG